MSFSNPEQVRHISRNVNLLLTPIAIWGLPGYTFKGIYKEIQKHLGSSVQNYIVAARTAQGYDDWHKSSREERLDVVKRWHAIQIEIANEKHQVRHGSIHGAQDFIKTQHLNHKEKKRLEADKRGQKKKQKHAGQKTPSAPNPVASTQSFNNGNGDYEEAIKASIAATSRGNPEEDKMIEQAIRASVVELQKASKDGNDDDAIQRAIKASVAEAARARKSDGAVGPVSELGDESAHDRELENALHRSVTTEGRFPSAHVESDDSGVDTDEDENIKAAIRQSTMSPIEPKDQDLELALRLSQESHGQHAQDLSKSKTEEEIVLDYVKRQSLLEEEHRRRRDGAAESGVSDVPAQGSEGHGGA